VDIPEGFAVASIGPERGCGGAQNESRSGVLGSSRRAGRA